jgi:hypothetical protein
VRTHSNILQNEQQPRFHRRRQPTLDSSAPERSIGKKKTSRSERLSGEQKTEERMSNFEEHGRRASGQQRMEAFEVR